MNRTGLVSTISIVGLVVVSAGQTNARGYYTAQVPAGNYFVTASRAGFFDASKRVVVKPGKRTTLDFTLSPRSDSGRQPADSSRPAPVKPCNTPAQRPAAESAPTVPGEEPIGPWAGQGSEVEAPSGEGGGGARQSTGPGGGLQALGGGGGNGSQSNGPASSTEEPQSTPPSSTSPASTPPSVSLSEPLRLELVRTVLTRHGNAARLVWSDDGKTLFLANEEGAMSAVKIDAADLTRPRIASTRKEVNFLWAVAQRQGLLVFHPSLGDTLLAIHPQDFSVRWTKRVGKSHAVETDGSRIFLPVEGKPGTLVVLSDGGQEVTRISEPDGWWRVYSMAYDEGTRRLYVGAGDNAAEGYPGGVYIYNVSSAPVLLGKINGASWDIAARGTRLWRQMGRSIEAWDVSNPASPTLLGNWYGQTERGPGGTLVRPQFGNMTVNRDGSRLYVAYLSVDDRFGRQVLDWHGGFMIFDIRSVTPILLARHGWKTDAGYWVKPSSVALSPDQMLLAVSYWAFGIRVYRVNSDQVAELGFLATTGEGHDVYVDNARYIHVFANDSIQTYDPQTGEQVGVYVTGVTFDGQWRPFKDGTIILPSARNGHARYILRLEDGRVSYVTALGNPGPTTWDEAFEDPYLYSAAVDGRIYIQRVGAFDPSTRKYPLQVLGSVQVGSHNALAITKHGNLIWTLGPSFGVAAVDVSNPALPRLVYQDRFTFRVNGNHAGIVSARERIYAGAGDAGVIIYDPTTPHRSGAISGYNANFLDTLGGAFLLISNYWYARFPDGLYVYDLRASPDAPVLTDWFPQPRGNANFRSRAFSTRVYRVPLYGVDVLDLR